MISSFIMIAYLTMSSDFTQPETGQKPAVVLMSTTPRDHISAQHGEISARRVAPKEIQSKAISALAGDGLIYSFSSSPTAQKCVDIRNRQDNAIASLTGSDLAYPKTQMAVTRPSDLQLNAARSITGRN